MPAKPIPVHDPGLLLARSLERSLRRVRTEQALAVDHLATTPVHDLRVALRRCRSLAEGFSELNPHSDWRHLRKACKKLLDGLTNLRDTQVLQEWAGRLGFDQGPLGASLRESLEHDQRHARRAARKTLAAFSPKRWKRWARRLPKRAARITAPEAHFARLALKRLKKARALEAYWRLHRSRQAAHHLRVALKRFRYTVESFLPEQKAWSGDLKKLQGLLGDVHDLDVLRQRVLPLSRAKAVCQEREKWLAKMESRRSKAVEDYWRAVVLQPATGAHPAARTLWDRWEKGLAKLAGVTFPIHAEPSPSKAKPASREARRSSRYPGTPRRLSAAR